MRILITGGAGFIGRALAPVLASRGHDVMSVVRRGEDRSRIPASVQARAVGDLGAQVDLSALMKDVDAIVHLAARVHQDGNSPDDETAHRAINTELTRMVAEQAAKSGVRRFIYASSVKAIGESTALPWTESSPCAPASAYGKAKLAAEKALDDISRRTSLEHVTLRFPLVYGPGVRANMSRLMSIVDRGVPLPFAWIDNRRSVLYVENACDAIAAALEHPAAKNQTFHVSDGTDLSTPELIRRIAKALGRPARLFPFPRTLLKASAAACGLAEEAGRLLDSLSIDVSKISATLSWVPPHTIDAGLARTAAWWRAR